MIVPLGTDPTVTRTPLSMSPNFVLISKQNHLLSHRGALEELWSQQVAQAPKSVRSVTEMMSQKALLHSQDVDQK